MIKIGLVGEDPSDTEAIKNFLDKKFAVVAQFIPLCKRVRGAQMDSPRFFQTVTLECHNKDCKIVVCIRDLDGLAIERNKIAALNKWYEKIRKNLDGIETIFLLNIWELEALLYADLKLFNSKYKTSLTCKGDPCMISDPKGKLKEATRKMRKKYVESDCIELFKELNFDSVVSRVAPFRSFLDEFIRCHKSFKTAL